ncbi:MAG: transposase [Lewinellaceae bacterium]|nr:transposase [Lewinellaceae bacterium]
MYNFYGNSAHDFYRHRRQQGHFSTTIPSEKEQWEVVNFGNNEAGIAALLHKAKALPAPHVVLEATGNYSMKVVFALCENQVPVSVLNPKQSKGFIQGYCCP